MAYLAAIAAGSGVPLFTRVKGDLPPLAYPKLASLNGAHFFTSSHGAELRSCTNGGVKTVWKTFYDNITMILVATDDGSCDDHMTYILELIFNAMVLVIGLEDLENPENLERLKQNLKWCYPAVDHLLEQDALLSPLTRCVDVVAIDDTNLLQTTLDGFIETTESSYGCLLVHHHICVATQNWWDLTVLEKSLLSLFLASLPPSTAKDIPVYLPVASNRIPHRLVVFSIRDGIEVCILCDTGPSLVEMKMAIDHHWNGAMEILEAGLRLYPRFPTAVTFDPSILAACLINMESRRCLASLSPSPGGRHDTHSTLSAGYRGEVSVAKKAKYLTRFYKTVVDQFLPSPAAKKSSTTTLRTTIPHQIRQTYFCTSQFKAYGLLKDHFIFILLFYPSTTTFSLRKMTEDIFEQIMNSPLTAFNIIKNI